MENNEFVFDIEVFPNFFSIDLFDGNEHTTFYFGYETNVKLVNDIYGFLDGKCLYGYNNSGYDDVIISYLFETYKGKDLSNNKIAISICKNLYNLSKKIISGKHTNDVHLSKCYKSVDLKKISNLYKSLKNVAINLKFKNIQEIPYDPNKPIDSVIQFNDILAYNKNDTEITWELRNSLLKEIELRKVLSEIYQKDLLSYSDSMLGDFIFRDLYLKKFCNKHNVSKSIAENNLKSPVFIKKIHLSKVVNDNVFFKTVVLKDYLESIKSIIIDVKNGEDKKDEEYKEIVLPKIKIRNKEYNLGLGGIHSNDDPYLYESSEDYKIIDLDATSYYPSIVINYKVKPLHVDDVFIDCMEELRNERVEAKRNKDEVKSQSFKIALNSVVGRFGYRGSWLYDMSSFLRVTINGQLYLLMLIESLDLNNIEIISANTDGITCLLHKDMQETFNNIVNEWQSYTGFSLEFNEYKKYVRTNVNNYMAVLKDGKIKTKGLFDCNPNLSQSLNMNIVSIALNKYYSENINIDKFIKNYEDILDFCLSQNIGNQFDLLYGNEKVQKVCRFYVSKKGNTLRKHKNNDDNKSSDIVFVNGRNVVILNKYDKNMNLDIKRNIDYTFYAEEIRKVINKIKSSSCNFSLFDNNV